MIEPLEDLRGHRVKVYTNDQGELVGTLSAVWYSEGSFGPQPVLLRLEDPQDLDTPFVVIPWAALTAMHPENGPTGLDNPYDVTEEAPDAPDQTA